MRAALYRAAKTGTPDRGRDLHDGRRHTRNAAPRSGAHSSRWCIDELAERAPRPRRLRSERRARRTPRGGRTRVGPLCLYGYDAHGNIAFLTDATGTETDAYTYDAWGNLVGRTGSTSNTRLFAGEELDPDLGLINLRARQYDRSTGRFGTLDPVMGYLRQPITMNRYLYANGDPVDLVDPNGREVEGAAYVSEAKADLTLLSQAAYGIQGVKAVFLGGAALAGSPAAVSLRRCVTTGLIIGKAIDYGLRSSAVSIGGLVALGIDLSCETIWEAVQIDKERGTL